MDSGSSLPAAALLMILADLDMSGLRVPVPRTQCVECHKEILPGRAGRRCLECRTAVPELRG